jgi:hypothetical protein
MSNTSNFSFCVELGISSVRDIFHLAFKNEPQCFPHNVGPFTRNLSGLQATVTVAILDDDSRPADLSFADEKHITFSLPNDITVEIADAPDPALSRIVLSSTAKVPGRLDSWADDAGEPVLGIRFDDVDPTHIVVEGLTGLPTIGVDQFTNAIHSRYDALPHRYASAAPGGTAELLLYDGVRDTSLLPPAPGNPPISAALQTVSGTEYLRVEAPIHVDVPTGFGTYHYVSFGRIRFWRQVTRTDTTITVAMNVEPGLPSVQTVLELDNTAPGQSEVAVALKPLAVSAINAFGALSAPAYSPAAAEAQIKAEIAAYVAPLRFGLWTPRSSEEGVVLTTPVGFLLVASDTLAVLVTRESGTEADDVAPDNFRGSHDVALAVSRQFVITRSDQVIQNAFPGVNGGGGYEFHRDQGDATLHTCHAEPENDGGHGKSPGHLWVTGDAEVHIDCWPDPDVTFSGPVYVDATPKVDPATGCYLELQPRAGEFDVGESCCDVLIDILIPVVGWIVLVVVENLIDEIGGQIAEETAGAQTQLLDPLPKLVIGIAQINCCLETLLISDQGFVFPGNLEIRRDGRSFEDLHDGGAAPRPDRP